MKLSTSSKVNSKQQTCFALPVGKSCPGRTEACKSCYACRGNHLYPSAVALDAHNWQSWQQYKARNDVTGCANALIRLISKVKADNFRPYERGDLDSAFAVAVWMAVIQAFPSKRFWLYTRSFWLELEKLASLPNCRIWLSIDEYNAPLVLKRYDTLKRLGVRLAYSMFTAPALPPNSIVCPAIAGQVQHDSACQACRFCFAVKPSYNVVFPLH